MKASGPIPVVKVSQCMWPVTEAGTRNKGTPRPAATYRAARRNLAKSVFQAMKRRLEAK